MKMNSRGTDGSPPQWWLRPSIGRRRRLLGNEEAQLVLGELDEALHLAVVHEAVAVPVGAADGAPGLDAGEPRAPAADGLPELPPADPPVAVGVELLQPLLELRRRDAGPVLLPWEQQAPAAARPRRRPCRRLEAFGRGGHGSYWLWLWLSGCC